MQEIEGQGSGFREARQASIRCSVWSLPRRARVGPISGDTAAPVRATRNGWATPAHVLEVELLPQGVEPPVQRLGRPVGLLRQGVAGGGEVPQPLAVVFRQILLTALSWYSVALRGRSVRARPIVEGLAASWYIAAKVLKPSPRVSRSRVDIAQSGRRSVSAHAPRASARSCPG